MADIDDMTRAARQVVANAKRIDNSADAKRIDNSADADALSDLLRSIEEMAGDIPPHYSERSEEWRNAYRIVYDVLQGEPGDDLVDIVDSAITDYRDARKAYPDSDESDIAFEIADGAVPVYTYQRMQVVAGSIHIATYEVESGLVGDDADMVTMAGVVLCEIVRDCLALAEREIEDEDANDDEDSESEA